MLHRSFKPAKCKTTLKLAASRIKLLKNKRDAQLKQLKKEVAQLLESGQDRTARIRVEHVVREEKTMEAYELLGIYCELIVARLQMVESQKNCPIDLKEAISSVIFASPRCADIPELMDVRKHFTAKYGKEFVSAAAELRPDCGVSRMLIEKLSAKAPDGQTKIKILSAIAGEHNIKWDPNSLEERDTRSPEDLLNGPSTFEKASRLSVEPHVQAPPDQDDRGSPNVQVSAKHDSRHDVSRNFYEQNTRSTSNSQNFDSADGGAKKAPTFSTFHAEAGSSGAEREEIESRHAYPGDGNTHSFGRQNWNMEFKDATSAAQAAAESAELASRAARAAAELSSRSKVPREYSTESHNSSAYGPRDEGSLKHAESKLQGEHLVKRPVNNDSPRRNSWTEDPRSDHSEQNILAGTAERFYRDDHKNIEKYNSSASLKSTMEHIHNNPLVNSSQNPGSYFQKNSPELENKYSSDELSMKNHPINSGFEFVNEPIYDMKSENVDYIGDVGIRKKSSRSSSHSRSHSSNFSDGAGQEPFPTDKGYMHTNNERTNSYDDVPVAFDEYGPDDEDFKFDDWNDESKGRESSLYLSSPSRESHTTLLENVDAWSPKKKIEEFYGTSIPQSHSSGGHIFSESSRSSRIPSQTDDFLHSSAEQHSSLVFTESFKSSKVPSLPNDLSHVTYDDSDSEEELEKSKLAGSTDPNISPCEQLILSRNSELSRSESHELVASSSAEKENVALERKPWSPPSSVDLEPMGVCLETNQGKESYGNLPTPVPKKSRSDLSIEEKEGSPRLPEDRTENEILKESSLEGNSELNFGKLTGGLRNKGFRRPPYVGSQSGDSSSLKQELDNSPSKIDQSLSSVNVRTRISPDARNQESQNQELISKRSKEQSTRAQVSSSDSDDDDSEELSRQTISTIRLTQDQKSGTEVNKNSNSRVTVPFFDEDSDREEDLPRQTSISHARPVTALSRRTKPSPSSTGRSTYLKTKGNSGALLSPDYAARERKSPSRGFYATDALQKPFSQTKSSDQLEVPEQRRSADQAPTTIPAYKRSLNEESPKKSTRNHSSGSLPKISTSGSSHISKTSNQETPSSEKSSHVHPKLPDYDALTAKFQSLRQGR